MPFDLVKEGAIVSPRTKEETSPEADDGRRSALEEIAGALRGLQFGEVTIIVQDGVIVQLDRLERRRLRARRK
jgi:hypothetical protein